MKRAADNSDISDVAPKKPTNAPEQGAVAAGSGTARPSSVPSSLANILGAPLPGIGGAKSKAGPASAASGPNSTAPSTSTSGAAPIAAGQKSSVSSNEMKTPSTGASAIPSSIGGASPSPGTGKPLSSSASKSKGAQAKGSTAAGGVPPQGESVPISGPGLTKTTGPLAATTKFPGTASGTGDRPAHDAAAAPTGPGSNKKLTNDKSGGVSGNVPRNVPASMVNNSSSGKGAEKDNKSTVLGTGGFTGPQGGAKAMDAPAAFDPLKFLGGADANKANPKAPRMTTGGNNAPGQQVGVNKVNPKKESNGNRKNQKTPQLHQNIQLPPQPQQLQGSPFAPPPQLGKGIGGQNSFVRNQGQSMQQNNQQLQQQQQQQQFQQLQLQEQQRHLQQQQQQQQQQQEAAADALQMAMMTMGNRQMPQGMPGLGVHAPNDALSGGGQQVGPGGVLPGMANSGLVARQLGVDDALAYLDKVKRQFNDKIDVYNRFLDIMKNFKAQTIDTPGVISHVCELFKGYDNLILGFNTFLPPGFKIELPNSEIGPMVGGQPVLTLAQQQELVERQVQHQQQQQQQMQMQQQRKIAGRGRGGAGPRPQGGPGNMNKGMQLPGAGRGGVMMGMMGDGRLNNGTMQMNMMDDATQANNQGQPVEFDHAIKYVTKIKKRFSAEADTYKTFLDILHSYQNEQRTIKEVLEQVSTLFKDHADLLKEFTYFLPDGVRESAKTELAKHAAKAQKASRMKANKSKKAGTPFSDLDHEESKVPQLERNLLGRIKAALGTRELWGEFLKCLDLFAQELISRGELLTLINDIFGERADLLEEFDRLLAVRGATDDPVESAWFSMPLTDIDFANCRRCTPSYRALPAAYPKAPCSERTAMCRSVLNDTWVSVPLGSEDSSSKGHRRNPFQDALFKCEDDRYEIDLIIDSGKAAIRALEPLAREIEALGLSNGEAAKFRYRLEKRTLSVIHLKAIARIYGDHGTEVLELLRRNPAGAIPVILKRLKEKDEEWCRDRHELNKSWKETMYRNYSKSLDHRSTHFKHMEKRCFTQKVLLAEIREKKSARTAAAAAASPDQATSDDDLIKLPLEDPSIHRDCWSLVGLKVEKTSHESVEADRVAAFLAYFCHSFFNMPDNWLAPGKSLMTTVSSKSMTEDSGSPKTREDAFPDDTKVETPYGSGSVKSFDVARGFYEIQLVYGVGFMRHNVVKLAASKDLPKTKQAVPAPLEDPEAVKQAKSNIGKEPVNFYSSIAVYVFMRQYQLLCQRLSDAKALCRNSPQPRRVKHVIDEAHEKEEASNAMEINEEGGDGEGDNDSDQAKERAAEARYAKLLSLIFALVGGSLESSKFEEETRTLLGPKIFFLYTIDKLVIAIQKQLVSIVNDEKGADVLERARSLCDKDSEGTALELSKIYQGTLSHLQLTDSSFLRLRYIPGTLKTEQEMQEAANSPGEPPLPEGHIVNVEKPVISEWKVPPTLGLSLVSKIPILESLTESDSPKTVPALCPLEVDFAPTLELSGVIDLKGSELRKVQSAPAKPATRMVLPIYKEVDLPVSDSALSVIKKTCASIESAGEEADKKTKSSAWYVQPLEDAMELAEASPAPAEAATVDSGTAASETAASNADDVEMKDANP